MSTDAVEILPTLVEITPVCHLDVADQWEPLSQFEEWFRDPERMEQIVQETKCYLSYYDGKILHYFSSIEVFKHFAFQSMMEAGTFRLHAYLRWENVIAVDAGTFLKLFYVSPEWVHILQTGEASIRLYGWEMESEAEGYRMIPYRLRARSVYIIHGPLYYQLQFHDKTVFAVDALPRNKMESLRTLHPQQNFQFPAREEERKRNRSRRRRHLKRY